MKVLKKKRNRDAREAAWPGDVYTLREERLLYSNKQTSVYCDNAHDAGALRANVPFLVIAVDENLYMDRNLSQVFIVSKCGSGWMWVINKYDKLLERRIVGSR